MQICSLGCGGEVERNLFIWRLLNGRTKLLLFWFSSGFEMLCWMLPFWMLPFWPFWPTYKLPRLCIVFVFILSSPRCKVVLSLSWMLALPLFLYIVSKPESRVLNTSSSSSASSSGSESSPLKHDTLLPFASSVWSFFFFLPWDFWFWSSKYSPSCLSCERL